MRYEAFSNVISDTFLMYLAGVPYMKRFDMPNPSNLWYSIDYPLVHITVMSSEHNYSIGSDQRNFLEKDLQSVDHKNKWLLFFGHRYFTEISSNFILIFFFKTRILQFGILR